MEISAPPAWHCVDFISDLHLQAACPLTVAACGAYLENTPADAVFILGDLFDAWIGDDCLGAGDRFASACAEMLRTACAGRALYIMQGNRDFLMGERLMQACGAHAVPDPCVLEFANDRWLLTHGDALCLDDTAYQQLRHLVRSDAWQQDFLAKPLAERQQLANGLRAASENAKRSSITYADLDAPACCALLAAHQARHLIHGHTHRPASHLLDGGCDRTVLSDWDCEAAPPRADVLRLSRHDTGAPTLTRLPGLALTFKA